MNIEHAHEQNNEKLRVPSQMERPATLRWILSALHIEEMIATFDHEMTGLADKEDTRHVYDKLSKNICNRFEKSNVRFQCGKKPVLEQQW